MQPEEPLEPRTLNYAAGVPSVKSWRTAAAIVLAVWAGVGAGFVLSVSGFGIFPVWLLFTILGPVLLCLFTMARHVRVAVVFQLSMMGFLILRLLASHPWGPSLAAMGVGTLL